MSKFIKQFDGFILDETLSLKNTKMFSKKMMQYIASKSEKDILDNFYNILAGHADNCFPGQTNIKKRQKIQTLLDQRSVRSSRKAINLMLRTEPDAKTVEQLLKLRKMLTQMNDTTSPSKQSYGTASNMPGIDEEGDEDTGIGRPETEEDEEDIVTGNHMNLAPAIGNR